jgi:hypothetical protein
LYCLAIDYRDPLLTFCMQFLITEVIPYEFDLIEPHIAVESDTTSQVSLCGVDQSLR